MKSDLRATLVNAIQDWIEEHADHESRPNGLFYDDLDEDMAAAAAAVYDASFKGQIFAKEQS